MSQESPYRCPVCGGSGYVPPGFYDRHDLMSTSIPTLPETCRTCGGTGVLWPPSEHTYSINIGDGISFSCDWSDLADDKGPATGHVTLMDDEGKVLREGEIEIRKGVTPKIPHDDLRVQEEITEDAYTYTLLNPDGTEAAPPLVFHRGSPEDGWRGWTTAHVLAALIRHVEFFQNGPFRCDENEIVLNSVRAAHRATVVRADRRRERGVLYDWRKP